MSTRKREFEPPVKVLTRGVLDAQRDTMTLLEGKITNP